MVPTIFNNANPYHTQASYNFGSYLAGTPYPSSSKFIDDCSFDRISESYAPFAGQRESAYNSDLVFLVGDEPIDRFLNAKKEVLQTSCKGIKDQIYARLDLRDKNLYEIDQRIGRADSILDQLDIFELGALPVIDKRKAFIEKELIAFEQERRFEQVACWRDVSRLQGQLLELQRQIDSQDNRQKLIGD